MFSPLEQFAIYPLIVLKVGFFDFSLTNQSLILFIILFLTFVFFFSTVKSSNGTLFLIPSRFQSAFEILYVSILNIVVENIASKRAQQFFPLIYSIFFLVAFMNFIGLIPYSFTVTSHFIATFVIGFSIFVGINTYAVRIHGIKIFALFLPSGTPLLLSFLIVPLELVLYLFRPISLSIRLFCNMMAGHILLKIFAGFAYTLINFSGILFFCHIIPLLILFPLIGLEFAVALIQSFVFSLLICIYLNDSLNLH
jgi:ATP synthase subunit 6